MPDYVELNTADKRLLCGTKRPVIQIKTQRISLEKSALGKLNEFFSGRIET